MGLFNKLMSKIFGQGASATQAGATATSPGASAPASGGATPGTPAAAGSNAGGGQPTGGATQPSGSAPVVDVAANLDAMAAKNSEKLDWKRSIVDLMKLVGMDSSLSARKELAKELNYTGDTSDSAAMNIWLHKQVLRKLSENGGKVPQELLS
jgi:hypothetical protein